MSILKISQNVFKFDQMHSFHCLRFYSEKIKLGVIMLVSLDYIVVLSPVAFLVFLLSVY